MKKINLFCLLLVSSSLLYITACKKSKTEVNESDSASPRAVTASKSPLNPKSPIYNLPFPAVLAYVGVNNENLNNMGCFKTNDGKQVVNIANIFAANINMSQEATPRPVVALNPQVSYLLEKTTYVKDLKAKGIKVTLSLLNNHDQSGWSQFTKQADADNFAKSVKAAIDKFGLDGIEIDDEYSSGAGNAQSIPMVVTAIRKLMPNIIIGYYIYSDSGVSASEILGKISDQITYAMTDYGDNPDNYVKYFKKTGNGSASDHSDRHRLFVGDHNGQGTLDANLAKVTNTQTGGLGGIMLFTGGAYSTGEYQKIAKALYGNGVTVPNPGSCLLKGGDKLPGLTDVNLTYVLSDGTLARKK